MKQQLEQIRTAAMKALEQAASPEELEALRVQFLGKKGELTAVLKMMGGLSAEERGSACQYGPRRDRAEARCQQKRAQGKTA